MTTDNENGTWVRRPDGIYDVVLPEHVTVAVLSKMMLSIKKNREILKEEGVVQRVLVDGSQISRFDAPARILAMTALNIIPKVKMAIYNRSAEHKRMDDSFDKYYPPPKNFKYLDKKDEAILWLNEK